MPRLLVVHHSPTRSMRRLTEAVLDGANDDEIEGVDVAVRPALEANAEDVVDADAYLLATPANFGYMSGALKHFFDSTFLAVGGSLADDGSADTGGEGSTAGRAYGVPFPRRHDTTRAGPAGAVVIRGPRWEEAAGGVGDMGGGPGGDRGGGS